MIFHWSLRDSKSPQVSRALLGILAVINNVIVWMVSTGPFIFKSSSPFNNSSVTVPREPITIIIIFHFHVPQYFQFPSKVFVLLYIFFHFYFMVSRDSKFHNFTRSFCGWLLQGLVVWPKLGDPFVCQTPIGVCVPHSRGHMLGCAYTIYSYGQI